MNNLNQKCVSVFASAVSDRSYYVRLEDNSLVMIDCGCMNLTEKNVDSKKLFEDYLAELRSVCGSEVVQVAALFITHPHDDHMNFFENIKKLGFDRYIKFEKIIKSFPPKSWIPQNNWENPDYPAMIEELINNTEGAEVITAKRGDVFEISNVKFEILLSADDAPDNAKDLNYFSMLIRQSYGNKTLLWTGDMSDSLSEQAINLYGDGLKCDVLQIPHHGTPNCGVLRFFELCNADLHLWTIAEQTFLDPEYMFAFGKYEIPTKIYNMPIKKVFCSGEKIVEVKM